MSPSNFPSINDLIPGGDQKPTPSYSSAQGKFQKKMSEIDIKEKEELVKKAAGSLGLPYIDLASFPVAAEALKVVPEDLAKEIGAICFYYAADEIRLGCLEKTEAVDELVFQLSERHQANVVLYLISIHSLERVLKLYANLPIVKPITKDINITDEELERFSTAGESLKSLQEQFQTVSISDILTLIIASALKMKASDIHVEAEEKGVVVRYRLDGILQDVTVLPPEQWKRFVSRIKLLAALKINVNDRPQDGRVTLKLSNSSLDVRVSTMPTIFGESVVMRILYSGSQVVTFDEMGLRGDQYERLRQEITRPNGMIITTGPTGSGKTTTMYAILRLLNKPGVKIITLEDPVEIKMEGINQSQVDPSHDYTFAKGLRSLLRQDPDICMVGEIRDLETAEIAIQSALTGHLMLSTIHTNSAAGAIPRFLSMGVKPFLLAPALNAIIGQRLVRRLCQNCLVEEKPESATLEKVTKILNTLPEKEKNKINFSDLHFYKSTGCEKCNNLGYSGRVGIFEIFTITKEIEQMVLGGKVSEYEIEENAVKNGMITMAQDGLLKVLDKVTSLEEVFRVAE